MKAKISFLFLSIILLAGCTKPTIEGKVVDYYNKPIKDVTITVEGTQFKSSTNDNGEYSVGYVPGSVNVLFQKSGYSETSKSFNIATESEFPAEQVQLIRIPAEKGVWYLGESDCITVSQGQVTESKTSYYQECGFRNYNITVTTFSAKGNFTSIENHNPKFMIRATNPIKLVRLIAEDESAILINDDGGGLFSLCTGSSKYKIIDVNTETLSTDVTIRTTSLNKGKYAFVEFVNNSDKPFKDEKPFSSNFYTNPYLFEIK